MSDVSATVEVNQPLRTVYNPWTQFEEFPRFMAGVEEVHQEDDATLLWRAEITGVERAWRSRIIEREPDRAIFWLSTEGTRNNSRVTFERLGPTTTRVHLALDIEPGDLVETARQMLGFVEPRAQGDLDRFRKFIEARSAETGAWRGEIRNGEVGGSGQSPLEAPSEVDPEA